MQQTNYPRSNILTNQSKKIDPPRIRIIPQCTNIRKLLLHFKGKGPSIWDVKAHEENYINNNENGDVACDSYHRYKEDVRLLKDLGVCEMFTT